MVRALLLAALLAPGPASEPEATAAAHPCLLAETPQVALVGRARARASTRFRVTGTNNPRIAWGDGSPVKVRRLRADGTITHRFAKAGKFTVKVTGTDGQCCDVQHTECTTTESTPDRLAVRVRRRS